MIPIRRDLCVVCGDQGRAEKKTGTGYWTIFGHTSTTQDAPETLQCWTVVSSIEVDKFHFFLRTHFKIITETTKLRWWNNCIYKAEEVESSGEVWYIESFVKLIILVVLSARSGFLKYYVLATIVQVLKCIKRNCPSLFNYCDQFRIQGFPKWRDRTGLIDHWVQFTQASNANEFAFLRHKFISQKFPEKFLEMGNYMMVLMTIFTEPSYPISKNL